MVFLMRHEFRDEYSKRNGDKKYAYRCYYKPLEYMDEKYPRLLSMPHGCNGWMTTALFTLALYKGITFGRKKGCSLSCIPW